MRAEWNASPPVWGMLSLMGKFHVPPIGDLGVLKPLVIYREKNLVLTDQFQDANMPVWMANVNVKGVCSSTGADAEINSD